MIELTDEMIARACDVYCQEHPEFVEELKAKAAAAGIPWREPDLTPSFHGVDCLGNGQHPEFECCCDECDHYQECFPDWRDLD